jgi:P27 family predicted phage terminase small subunit
MGVQNAGNMPRPVEQRRREGDISHRPLPEPMLVGGRPNDDDAMLQCPEHLPKDGRDAWNDIVPTLQEVGLLDRVDRLSLAAMCMAWARAMQAGKVIARQGHLVRGSQGQIREHPSLRTERENYRQFLTFAEHFALTPVARTRLGLAELHRRSLKAEMSSALGEVQLTPVDATVVEDEDDA